MQLAAQAGVRKSIETPEPYTRANLVGFNNVLEVCRQCATKHLAYASSSSVYGSNARLPFSTRDSVDHPISLYAATKKANELMAPSYNHLYRLPSPDCVFNLGNHHTVELNHLIEVLERSLGKTAIRNPLPMQPGDVPATKADVSDLVSENGYTPSMTVDEGVPKFVEWCRRYHAK